MAKSFLGKQNLPRGLRNNNPGNIIQTNIGWKGKLNNPTDSRFEQFIDLKHGIRALYRQLNSDVNKRGLNLHELINKYAPAHENNTTAYIQFVTQQTGISPFSKIELDSENLVQLAKAIISIENGSQYGHLITNQDYNDAFEILGLSIKKK